MVQWGGEILNMRPEGMHTNTQMGSDHFAEEGLSKASYFYIQYNFIYILDFINNATKHISSICITRLFFLSFPFAG
jgi:hypothetical protein